MDDKLRSQLIRLYYSNGSSATETLRAYRRETGERNPPCTEGAIRKLIKKFENEYSISDMPRSGRPSASGDRESMVEETLQDIQNQNSNQQCSVRQLSKATKIPKSSVHRILRQSLDLKPYKPSFVQELKPHDYENRVNFVRLAGEKLNDDYSTVFWTDEAHFYLHGEASSISGATWAASNPHITFGKPLHSPKVTVWIGMNRTHISPPYFFEGNVDANSYLEMLKTHCVPFLKSKRMHSKTFFMQDGAAPHVAIIVKDFLKKEFKGRIISRHFDFYWPARSPDLTPLDFWFWGFVKREVYKENPKTINELKEKMTNKVNTIFIIMRLQLLYK